jgi:hypothetical protein
VVLENFPWQKIMGYFFQGRDIFRCLKAIEVCCSTNKSMAVEAYTQELQVVLRCTLLATLVTPVGTPSSGSASGNTCIQIDLYILKLSKDKPINLLTIIVPLRKTLGKILSSTWVVK